MDMLNLKRFDRTIDSPSQPKLNTNGDTPTCARLWRTDDTPRQERSNVKSCESNNETCCDGVAGFSYTESDTINNEIT